MTSSSNTLLPLHTYLSPQWPTYFTADDVAAGARVVAVKRLGRLPCVCLVTLTASPGGMATRGEFNVRHNIASELKKYHIEVTGYCSGSTDDLAVNGCDVLMAHHAEDAPRVLLYIPETGAYVDMRSAEDAALHILLMWRRPMPEDAVSGMLYTLTTDELGQLFASYFPRDTSLTDVHQALATMTSAETDNVWRQRTLARLAPTLKFGALQSLKAVDLDDAPVPRIFKIKAGSSVPGGLAPATPLGTVLPAHMDPRVLQRLRQYVSGLLAQVLALHLPGAPPPPHVAVAVTRVRPSALIPFNHAHRAVLSRADASIMGWLQRASTSDHFDFVVEPPVPVI